MNGSVRERLCLALDVATSDEAARTAAELRRSVGMFKVGSELFVNEGPGFVRDLTNEGHRVFLDLKFHDIPNTVAGAARAATRLGVSMFNIHAAGGAEMIAAAVRGARDEAAVIGTTPPRVLAVTVLTSIDEDVFRNELLGGTRLESAVVHYAKLAQRAGADGVVASATEVTVLRSACGPAFLIVTPGIRPLWSAAQDQRRISTPRGAIEAGADILVIGRPILAAEDRVQASEKIVSEMLEAVR